jgi:hypothetical protein
MVKPYQVNVNTINLVSGLPIEGEDPTKKILAKDVSAQRGVH